MVHPPPILRFLFLAAALLLGPGLSLHAAGYKDDIGFSLLEDELGTAVPTGQGVHVSQVEALATVVIEDETVETWILDDTHAEFDGKTIVFKSSVDTTATSSHATTVGRYFFGNTLSIAPAIGNIDAYEVNDWLTSGFLALGVTWGGNPVQPHYEWPSDLASPSRIANHSWVGTAGTYDADLLRRLDFVIETDEYQQIVAVNNSTPSRALLSSAFNAVTVGLTNGSHPSDTAAVDAVYTAGRACPLVVVPLAKTSYANPVVAATTALLWETGSDPALSTDPLIQGTTNRDGDVIANAQRSEVIKAALLCGARRVTQNTASTDQIDDYRIDSGNGLDSRFGAGQVDGYHSYHVIAAGEQNSREDNAAGGGRIAPYGFDCDPAFGGSGASNAKASYEFTAGEGRPMLYAALVWHLDIDGGVFYDFDDTATRYNFDLVLLDVTEGENPLEVAVSSSTIDNTENLWFPLTAGHAYRMEVRLGTGQATCLWDYGLAWRITTPPDTDGDTLPDDWEVYHGLDHKITDSEGDGLPDGWEVAYGLDPLTDDGSLDADDDGLDNLAEFETDTFPDDPDTDDDGHTDGDEVAAGTDPLDPDSHPVAVAALDPCQLLFATLLLLGFGLRCRIR